MMVTSKATSDAQSLAKATSLPVQLLLDVARDVNVAQEAKSDAWPRIVREMLQEAKAQHLAEILREAHHYDTIARQCVDLPTFVSALAHTHSFFMEKPESFIEEVHRYVAPVVKPLTHRVTWPFPFPLSRFLFFD
jgi:hypothetical protein